MRELLEMVTQGTETVFKSPKASAVIYAAAVVAVAVFAKPPEDS